MSFLGFSPELSADAADPAQFIAQLSALASGWFLLSASPRSHNAHAALLSLGVASGFDASVLGAHGGARSLLQAANATPAAEHISSVAPACPQDDADCVYQCLSAGFATEVFGPTILLVSRYAGAECNCSKVFPRTAANAANAYMLAQVLALFPRPFTAPQLVYVAGSAVSLIY